MIKYILAIMKIVLLEYSANAQNVLHPALTAQPVNKELRIGLKSNTGAEVSAKKQLEEILKAYKIDKWIFTDTIAIDKHGIPHSHPILTLNTKYLNNDTAQLSTFLHEQFHWLVSNNKSKLDMATAEFEKEYPAIPEALPFGAKDRFSGYLHLIVCDLEFQAMTELFGEQKARKILQAWKHYTWIYEKVLNDKTVRVINSKYGFLIE
jgi:hypothetical protein